MWPYWSPNTAFPQSIFFQSFHVVLFFQQVRLHFLWQWQVIDVVSPHSPENEKAAHVLQGGHTAKAGDGVQELDGKRGGAGARRAQEVKKAAVLGVLHRLFDELADLGFAVWVGLRPEAEQAWKAETGCLHESRLDDV